MLLRRLQKHVRSAVTTVWLFDGQWQPGAVAAAFSGHARQARMVARVFIAWWRPGKAATHQMRRQCEHPPGALATAMRLR
jgi:hypothetical protein